MICIHHSSSCIVRSSRWRLLWTDARISLTRDIQDSEQAAYQQAHHEHRRNQRDRALKLLANYATAPSTLNTSRKLSIDTYIARIIYHIQPGSWQWHGWLLMESVSIATLRLFYTLSCAFQRSLVMLGLYAIHALHILH